MNDVVNEQFERLLSKLSESGLTEAEYSDLGRLVAFDPLLRSRYLEYCQMHALLRAEHGLLASWGVPEIEVAPLRQRSRWRWSRRWIAVCCAASVAVICAAVLWNAANETASLPIGQPPPHRGPQVARLTKHVGARFVYGPHGNSIPLVGEALPQGTYELEDGIVEVQSNSGAVLVIEAPAIFTLADQQCVRMENGRLAAHVPPSAVGFRVETASATVVDLGTDFAVEAVSGRDSEVHVFDGEVKIDLHGSKATSARPLHLSTGKAARIDFDTGMPSGIDLDAQRFLRRLETESHAYARRILQLKPAAYFPMEPSADASSLRDAGPRGIDARINFGQAREPVWAAGKFGLAFALGGPGQQTYASADHYEQTDGDQLSVVAWVTARSRPRWASIAKNWAGADDRGQFHFGLYDDSGELEAHIEDSSGEEIIVKDQSPLPLHRWHHVAFVADGETLRLYRNGQQVDAEAYRQLQRDPRIRALAIGTKLNLAGDAPDHSDFNMWDGRLDELAIFNKALSPQQIRELYELGNKSQ